MFQLFVIDVICLVILCYPMLLHQCSCVDHSYLVLSYAASSVFMC